LDGLAGRSVMRNLVYVSSLHHSVRNLGLTKFPVEFFGIQLYIDRIFGLTTSS
jgi:hypothetical protein